MVDRLRGAVHVVLWAALLGCGDGTHPSLPDGKPSIDARPSPDASGDAAPADVDADGCRLDARELCGDGADNNCDGSVDEGCTCVPGAVQPCFAGKPAQRHVGACVDGQQLCVGDPGAWSACQNGIAPGPEICDGVDNDCDAVADDALACDGALRCPAPGSLPDARPFQDYVLDGTQMFAGTASWTWTVTGGPCDQLFASQGPNTSFGLHGSDTSQLTFRPAAVGDYLVHVTMRTSDTEELGCSFPVHVAGSGLSVELCWDTSGADDLDLHLHAPGSTADWFTDQDCYYMNCQGSSSQHIDWGYPRRPLDACKNGPDGAAWTELGGCITPRLDANNVNTPATAEQITLDTPADGATYRTMVNYLGSTQGENPVSHPLTNIYCQGRLVASLGRAPDRVIGFAGPGANAAGATWRAADITTHVSASGVTTCSVAPLHPPGETTGFDIRHNDASY